MRERNHLETSLNSYQDLERELEDGVTLAELAEAHAVPVPDTQHRAKGWTGTLLETCLGATAGSKAAPDFQRISVEMKTVPIGTRNKPTESTYVCTTHLTELTLMTWENSWVRK